jgi:hypothetical protein
MSSLSQKPSVSQSSNSNIVNKTGAESPRFDYSFKLYVDFKSFQKHFEAMGKIAVPGSGDQVEVVISTNLYRF